MPRKPTPFWDRVDRSGDCWVWTGPVMVNGYGKYHDPRDRRQKGAHRIAYELTYGPIPSGLYVCHRCDNPPCVRPEHLLLGTAADNNRDAMAKGRLRGNGFADKTECKRGHPLSGENLYISPQGGRTCRACVRLMRRPKPRKPRPRKTHCLRGHPMTPDNLYIRRDGQRACRACVMLRDAQRKAHRSIPVTIMSEVE